MEEITKWEKCQMPSNLSVRNTKNQTFHFFAFFYKQNGHFDVYAFILSVHFLEKHKISVFLYQLSVCINGKLKSATATDRGFCLLSGNWRGHWFEPVWLNMRVPDVTDLRGTSYSLPHKTHYPQQGIIIIWSWISWISGRTIDRRQTCV